MKLRLSRAFVLVYTSGVVLSCMPQRAPESTPAPTERSEFDGLDCAHRIELTMRTTRYEPPPAGQCPMFERVEHGFDLATLGEGSAEGLRCHGNVLVFDTHAVSGSIACEGASKFSYTLDPNPKYAAIDAELRALPPPAKVDVPIELVRSYDVLMRAKSLLSWDGTCFGGEDNFGADAEQALVAAKRPDLIVSLLRARSTEARIFALRTLRTLPWLSQAAETNAPMIEFVLKAHRVLYDREEAIEPWPN
jgi:hypothetical protein